MVSKDPGQSGSRFSSSTLACEWYATEQKTEVIDDDLQWACVIGTETQSWKLSNSMVVVFSL